VGCASGVSRQADTDISGVRTALSEPVSKENPISLLTLELSREAKNKLSDNSSFDEQALFEKISSELTQSGLYVEQTDNIKLNIMVTDLRIRSGFSAVMFGFFAGNDFISGEVSLIGENNTQLDRFSIEVSYAFGGVVGGETSFRTEWLYSTFTAELIKELKGKNKEIPKQ